MSLLDLSLQEMRRRQGRTVLTLLSIVLGVAALVAVGMAIHTTHTSFGRMYESLAGSDSLRVEARGGGRFPETALRDVGRQPGVLRVTPVLRQSGLIYTSKDRLRLQLVGVPVGSTLSNYQLAEGRYFEGEDEVMLENGLARGIGVKVGDEVQFLTRSGVLNKQVVGLLAPTSAAALTSASTAAFWPLPALQEACRAAGKLNAALVTVKEGEDVARVRSEIAAVLPEGVTVVLGDRQDSEGVGTQGMIDTAMALAGLLAIVAMGFVIFNTFLMNLSERRRNLAVLRVLGASRGQIRWMLLREGVALGAVGSLVGLPLGYGLALLLVRGVGSAFQASLPPPQLTLTWLGLALAQGILLVIVSVLYPAHLATSITPLEGLRRNAAQPPSRRGRPWLALAGLVLVAAAVALMVYQASHSLPIQAVVVGPVLLLLAMVFLCPAVLAPAIRAAAWPVRLVWPIPGALAQEQMLRHPGRTHLTWTILFIASAGAYALGDVLISTIADVHTFYQHTLHCDFILRSAYPGEQSGETAGMDLELAQRLQEILPRAEVTAVRFFPVELGDNRLIAVARQFERDRELPLALREGPSPAEVSRRLEQGELVLAAVAAQQLGLGPGSEIELESAGKKHRFRVAATCSGYAQGGFSCFIDYAVAARLFGIEGADLLVVTANTRVDASLQRQLQQLADDQGAILQSYLEVSRTIDGLLAGVTAGLWALLVLGFLIALFGDVNTLTMNVLEQTQEIGLLRVVGMTRRDIRRFVLAQAAQYGLLSIGPGLVCGALLSYLVRVGARGMFGATTPLFSSSIVLPLVAVLAFVVVVAVAWLPARRAMRVPMLAAVVRE